MNTEQFDQLIAAIRAIAHGTPHAPTGLELLAEAIAGKGSRDLAAAVTEVADAVHAVAGSLSNIAEAIGDHDRSNAT